MNFFMYLNIYIYIFIIEIMNIKQSLPQQLTRGHETLVANTWQRLPTPLFHSHDQGRFFFPFQRNDTYFPWNIIK